MPFLLEFQCAFRISDECNSLKMCIFLQLVHMLSCYYINSSYLPAYEGGTECSETSAYKIQTLENYPEESIQHSEHGRSLKSRITVSNYCQKMKKRKSNQNELSAHCCGLFTANDRLLTPLLHLVSEIL